MGYTFAAGDWMQPANDALHALLVKRAEESRRLQASKANRRESIAAWPATDGSKG